MIRHCVYSWSAVISTIKGLPRSQLDWEPALTQMDATQPTAASMSVNSTQVEREQTQSQNDVVRLRGGDFCTDCLA
jgi:hypothetical protein